MIVKRWNERILGDTRLTRMADSGKINLDYHWINYEELHSNIEAGRSEIYAYLGLDPSKANPLDEATYPGFTKANNENDTVVRSRGVKNSWEKYFTDDNLQWFSEVGQQGLDLHQATRTIKS